MSFIKVPHVAKTLTFLEDTLLKLISTTTGEKQALLCSRYTTRLRVVLIKLSTFILC